MLTCSQLCSQEGKQNRKRSRIKRLLCCFSVCCKSDSDAGGEAPSQVHLLE